MQVRRWPCVVTQSIVTVWSESEMIKRLEDPLQKAGYKPTFKCWWLAHTIIFIQGHSGTRQCWARRVHGPPLGHSGRCSSGRPREWKGRFTKEREEECQISKWQATCMQAVPLVLEQIGRWGKEAESCLQQLLITTGDGRERPTLLVRSRIKVIPEKQNFEFSLVAEMQFKNKVLGSSPIYTNNLGGFFWITRHKHCRYELYTRFSTRPVRVLFLSCYSWLSVNSKDIRFETTLLCYSPGYQMYEDHTHRHTDGLTDGPTGGQAGSQTDKIFTQHCYWVNAIYLKWQTENETLLSYANHTFPWTSK